MGFLEVLTLVFVGLKAFGVISWSWWLVFLPLYVAVGIYIIIFALWALGVRAWFKAFKRISKDVETEFDSLDL